MAEKRSLFSRLKALIGTLAGLLSGAALMYVSPLVDQVVKPGKPLANFAVETDGLTATFHNRYAGEGWWDFGDGSPLEPATPNDSSVTHTYARPGTYPAKLMVRNFVGDEHERSVSVNVTVTAAASSESPVITSVEVVPISADRSAPATFRFVAKTTGAERCLWDLGGDRPLEVVTSGLDQQDRFVTFVTPGQHTIQITALGGGQAVRKNVTVQVEAQRADTLVARLRVTDRGTRTEKRQTTEMIPITLTKNARGTIAIDRRLAARTGFTISEAKLGATEPAFSNLKLTPSADGHSVQITGQLSPTSAMRQAQTPPSISVILTQERQLKMLAPPAEVTASVSIPGAVSLPMPASPIGVVQPKRSMVLELRGSGGAVWQQPLPARASLIEFQGRRYTISATPGDREVRLEVVPATAGLTSREK